MPTRAVAANTMKVGKKGGGKHWTAAQVAARKQAAEELKRTDDQKLKPPDWLGKEARLIWNQKLKEASGVDLLDVLDRESLSVYCVSVVKFRQLSEKSRLKLDDHKTLQAYMRIISQLADKLGFNPGARARLIKKRAEDKEKDKFGDKFD